jgi:hypothetical protein
MINKQIGLSLIALTLVVVYLSSATNVYGDSYKHKGKDGKGLRVIIDLVKEDKGIMYYTTDMKVNTTTTAKMSMTLT